MNKTLQVLYELQVLFIQVLQLIYVLYIVF